MYLCSPVTASAVHNFTCLYGSTENVQNEATILTARRKYDCHILFNMLCLFSVRNKHLNRFCNTINFGVFGMYCRYVYVEYENNRTIMIRETQRTIRSQKEAFIATLSE